MEQRFVKCSYSGAGHECDLSDGSAGWWECRDEEGKLEVLVPRYGKVPSVEELEALEYEDVEVPYTDATKALFAELVEKAKDNALLVRILHGVQRIQGDQGCGREMYYGTEEIIRAVLDELRRKGGS